MNAKAESVAVDRLSELDATLGARAQPPMTLAPARPRAHLPSELFAMLAHADDSPDFTAVLAEGIAEVFEAIGRAFPDNLFWDLDGLFGTIVASARSSQTPGRTLEHALREVAAVQDVFGRGPINFRYIHDFVYGFDWAKWVARDPAQRSAVGPFDPPFVAAMKERGEELLDVIERDVDAKYPPLQGDEPRNPFGFSREPSDEQRLHRTLAQRKLIPVETWSVQPTFEWSRPFADLRAQVAAELGLSRPKE